MFCLNLFEPLFGNNYKLRIKMLFDFLVTHCSSEHGNYSIREMNCEIVKQT